MKKFIFTVIVLAFANTLSAQTNTEKPDSTESAVEASKQHKIVFQLASDDTLAHKALMRQINNLITVAPLSKIEVVCHGPGIAMLMLGKTTVQQKIQNMKKKPIAFMACEFTMKEKNITKDKIIPEAGFVQYGILEIVQKQEEGWSYIKSGF